MTEKGISSVSHIPALSLITEEKVSVKSAGQTGLVMIVVALIMVGVSFGAGWYILQPGQSDQEAIEEVRERISAGAQPATVSSALPTLNLNQTPQSYGPVIQANPSYVGKTDPFQP